MSMLSASTFGPAAAFLVAVAIATVSCADTPLASAERPAVVPADSPSGVEPVERLIGNAACRNDGECRVIGVGAKACGGPEAYRAWSVAATDARSLEEAVARDAAGRKKEIERAGMLSNCAITPIPAVACVSNSARVGAGRCTLMPAGGAAR